MKKHYSFLFAAGIVANILFGQSTNFQWAKKMGGNSNEYGNSMAVDVSGNVYTTGWFNDTIDFDPGVDTANLSSMGYYDTFISKLDANGNFVWARRIGGALETYAYSIAVDILGNVYTTGYFQGTTDFDPGANTFNLSSSASSVDVFVSKLDSNGNFVWAKRMGGTSNDYGNSIAVSASGNVYTTGWFSGMADFDPGTGTNNITSAGNFDIFLSKLDAAGNFVWVKQIGGISGDAGTSITLDSVENVYTTGWFVGTADFDPGTDTTNLTSTGPNDIFISKLDASGNFMMAKQMEVNTTATSICIAIDASGNIFTTGYFKGMVDFDPGTGTNNLTSSGEYDIFVTKLDASGKFEWAKQVGDIYYDFSNSMSLDASGNVYITGSFTGVVDFDPGIDIARLISVGLSDIYILKLDANGNFVWAKQMGSNSDDWGYSITLDTSENIYTTGGFTYTVDFDPGAGIMDLTSDSLCDIFVHKMSQNTVAGIRVNTLHNEAEIFPNPATDKLTIQLNSTIRNSSVEIFNAKGALKLTALTDQLSTQSIDISELSPGIYFLRVTNDRQSLTSRFVKQ